MFTCPPLTGVSAISNGFYDVIKRRIPIMVRIFSWICWYLLVLGYTMISSRNCIVYSLATRWYLRPVWLEVSSEFTTYCQAPWKTAIFGLLNGLKSPIGIWISEIKFSSPSRAWFRLSIHLIFIIYNALQFVWSCVKVNCFHDFFHAVSSAENRSK